MTNEELLARLDERSKGYTEKLTDIKGDVHEILTLAKSTNGRVTKLEQWKAVVQGQGKIVWVIAGLSGTGIGFLLKHFLA